MIDLASVILFGGGVAIDEPIAPPPVVKPFDFFVHFNEKTRDIACVTTNPTPEKDLVALKINRELGEKLLRGEDNVLKYSVIKAETDAYELVEKASIAPVIPNRLEIVDRIYELEKKDKHLSSIWFEVLESEGVVAVHYDGEVIKTCGTVKFYLSRYDDPSHLKCAFSLDVNILNGIIAENNWEEWPNPIRLKIDDVSDLSIYGIKGQVPASLI